MAPILREANHNLRMACVDCALHSTVVTVTTPSESYYISFGTLSDPTFSLSPGTYTEVQTVTIATADAEATIRYTTDGSDPTLTSAQFTGPITLDATTTLKAKAFKNGWAASGTASATYTIDLGEAAPPTMDPRGGRYATEQTVTLTSTTSGVDFVEVLSEDVCDFLKGAKKNFIELGVAETSLQRLVLASPFCDFQTEGEAEQSLRVEEGTDGAPRKAPPLEELFLPGRRYSFEPSSRPRFNANPRRSEEQGFEGQVRIRQDREGLRTTRSKSPFSSRTGFWQGWRPLAPFHCP